MRKVIDLFGTGLIVGIGLGWSLAILAPVTDKWLAFLYAAPLTTLVLLAFKLILGMARLPKLKVTEVQVEVPQGGPSRSKSNLLNSTAAVTIALTVLIALLGAFVWYINSPESRFIKVISGRVYLGIPTDDEASTIWIRYNPFRPLQPGDVSSYETMISLPGWQWQVIDAIRLDDPKSFDRVLVLPWLTDFTHTTVSGEGYEFRIRKDLSFEVYRFGGGVKFVSRQPHDDRVIEVFGEEKIYYRIAFAQNDRRQLEVLRGFWIGPKN